MLLSLYQVVSRHLTLRSASPLAALLARLPINLKRQKVSKINLKLTGQPESLQRSSMQQTWMSVLEAPRLWHLSPSQFEQMLNTTPPVLKCRSGCLVLTPPLGSREALMRYLGSQNCVTEYYHSNSVTSLDRMIRATRTSIGVKLVGHDEPGRKYIAEALRSGQIATLCPDQQPRLRGGLFVPFFGQPALTTLAIPDFLRTTQCKLYMGSAIRVRDKYEIELTEIELQPSSTDEDILTAVNQALEQAIMRHPEQYRWSDKRFNIQPRGTKKVYR